MRVRWPRSLLVGLLLAITLPAHAQSGYERKGVNVRVAAGLSTAHLESNGSISNGFQQPIPSLSNAVGPRVEARVGGTLGELVQLGGSLRVSTFSEPHISTLGRQFRMVNAHIVAWSLGPYGTWYPIPNWFVTGSVSIAGVEVRQNSSGFDGAQMGETGKGFDLSFEVGREWWLSRTITLGVMGAFQYQSLTATNQGLIELAGGSGSGAPHLTLLQPSISLIVASP